VVSTAVGMVLSNYPGSGRRTEDATRRHGALKPTG
jgi:hypothetical protein